MCVCLCVYDCVFVNLMVGLSVDVLSWVRVLAVGGFVDLCVCGFMCLRVFVFVGSCVGLDLCVCVFAWRWIGVFILVCLCFSHK